MLNILVFVAGMVTLGVELSAARLLDPYFGNSILVWAALIGLVLACLSLGYWLGGRLADRRPSVLLLYTIALMAAVLVGLIPVAARPILQVAAFSTLNLENASLSLLLTAGAVLFLLLSIPTILLGTISPFSIRLALSSVQTGGQVAGRLYALSTVGSLLGTFLPVLVLIPAIGTRLTFVLLAATLATTAVLGLFLEQPRSSIAALATLPFLAVLGWLAGQGAIKPEAGLVHEGESLYNYLQVLQKGPETWLKLNEGIGLHSVYHPQSPLSEGIWDYFLVAPLFAAAPSQPDGKPVPSVDDLYLVGLAGGTVAQLYSDVYGPMPIDGVELDPAILEVAETYFHLDEYPNITGTAADGRNWLLRQPADKRYSVIAVDAYRPPYIPFHLATVEFFELLHQHLDENGVVAVNAARSSDDYSLVQALASTMGQVFPAVYVVDESTADYTLGNSLLVATVQPTTLADFEINAAAVQPEDNPILAEMTQRAKKTARPADTSGSILTDDRAPIEQIIHGIMLRYLLAN
jgi:predicted membrane-bound spermidine synthase